MDAGTPLELKHEDGWWQVAYVATRVGTDEVLVQSSHWGGSRHLVITTGQPLNVRDVRGGHAIAPPPRVWTVRLDSASPGCRAAWRVRR